MTKKYIHGIVRFIDQFLSVFTSQKPDNIGFDNEDTVKIFDFGLAKELQDSERDENGLYRMTCLTGTIPNACSMSSFSWNMINTGLLFFKLKGAIRYVSGYSGGRLLTLCF